MRVKNTGGGEVEIADTVILAAAGAIYARRRRTHGGPPKRTFPCPWCTHPCVGRVALEAHERDCDARPSGDLVGVSDEDMRALEWTPPDAA